jgi:predicted deacylase
MSNNELRVGNLSAAPGHKTVGLEQVTLQGQAFSLPIFLIHGQQAGPTLAVSAGIHGAEYASIAAGLEFGRQLQVDGLRGCVIVAPLVNVPAFRARSIYVCPLDGKNLNRVFPGNPEGTASEQLAHWLFQNVIQPANYFVDLHGGDLVEALEPYVGYFRSGNEAVDKVSLEMASVFGLHYVVPGASQGTTYSMAARAGIPGILAEAGGQGIWPPEHVALLTNGLNRLMRHLGMVQGPALEPVPVQVFSQSVWVRSEHEGFYYPKAKVGELVHKGQDLGSITDFQGNVLQPLTAPADGRVMFVVTSLAINKNDPLLSLGV